MLKHCMFTDTILLGSPKIPRFGCLCFVILMLKTYMVTFLFNAVFWVGDILLLYIWLLNMFKTVVNTIL